MPLYDPGPPALLVQGLTKKYGKHTVIDNLDLDLPPASLVGLLGPNGAGKSTLMKMLAGLIVPDAGLIRIAGHDLRREEMEARSNLAYVPDVPSLYPELTVLEHLELTARAHKVLATFRADAEMLLQRFGLWEARDSPTYALSRGMSQKLALSGALIRPSQVLLLDEPGSALDIASLDELYAILEDYRRSGGLALLSSHQWETLQDLCDRFVLLGFGTVESGELQYLRRVLDLHEDASLREVYLAFMRERALETVRGRGDSRHNGR